MTVFTYKCTNCHTSNKTQTPPEDNMLHCVRCGYLTVQYFHSVKGKSRFVCKDAAKGASDE